MNLLKLWEFHHQYAEGDMVIYNDQCIHYKNGEWRNVPMPPVHDIQYKSWNPDRRYVKGQFVVFGGLLWVCIEDHFCDVNPDVCKLFKNEKIE